MAVNEILTSWSDGHVKPDTYLIPTKLNDGIYGSARHFFFLFFLTCRGKKRSKYDGIS